MKKTIIALIVLVLAGLGIGYFSDHRPVKENNDGREMFPKSVQAVVAANPDTQVKRCMVGNEAYFVTDAIFLADEENDVYDAAGTKVGACFAFTAEPISPFCNSIGAAECTVLYTPNLEKY